MHGLVAISTDRRLTQISLGVKLALAISVGFAATPADEQIAERARAERARLATPQEQMLMAARDGRLAAVQSALAAGTDLYYSDQFEMNVLAHAIAGKKPEVVDWLLGPGKFDVTVVVKFRSGFVDEAHTYLDQAGAPALAMAAMVGDTDLVALLLQKGMTADANATTLVPRAFYSAVANHNRGAAKLLIKAGANPTWGNDKTGMTHAPHHLINDKDLDLLEMCFEYGHLDADYREGDGRTLVARAAQIGWTEGVNLMLNRGASPFMQDLEGKNAFDLAANDGVRDQMLAGALARASDGSPQARAAIALFRAILKDDVTEALRACDGKALNYVDPYHRTPLIYAIYIGHERSARQILAAKPDVNVCADSGTALAWACDRRMFGIAEDLLRMGANPELIPGIGSTAFEIAALQGQTNLVAAMLKAGAKVDSPRSAERPQPRTALMCAAMNGHKDVIRMLLSAHANPDEIDENHNAVLSYAVLSDDPTVVQMLLDAGATKGYANPNGLNAASYAMLNGKVKALRKLTELDLRDERTAARVSTAPMTSRDMMLFLKEHYNAGANEAGFWASHPTLPQVQGFLKSGGTVNFVGETTPLQGALKDGYFDVARYLVEQGASVTLVGSSPEWYPLELAVSGFMSKVIHSDLERKAMVEFLLKNGASADAHRGLIAPLLAAVDSGYTRVAKTLLAAGADPLVKSPADGAGLPEILGRNTQLSPMEKRQFEMETGQYYQKALQKARSQKPAPKPF